MSNPETHATRNPHDLVGSNVRVRPYYNVPKSRTFMESVRSWWTTEARVVSVMNEMVVVRYRERGPWESEAAYFPRELHLQLCRCNACHGEGIDVTHGP